VEGKGKFRREKSKLASTWERAFRIVKYVGDGPSYSDYMIQFTAGQKLQQVVNTNRLKPFYGEEESDEEDEEEGTGPEVDSNDLFDIDNEVFTENRIRYWNQPVYKERTVEDKSLGVGEYEIERIVDVRRTGRGRKKVIEFRVK
tara:strand:- start:340 stop:771 length:432 start_codon:yes stop_codon:yes gene_type:complete